VELREVVADDVQRLLIRMGLEGADADIGSSDTETTRVKESRSFANNAWKGIAPTQPTRRHMNYRAY